MGATDEEEALAEAAYKAGRGTALLVDHEDLARMSSADMLMEIGHEVIEARSAEEALKLVGEGLRPDVLVTDTSCKA